MWDAFVLGRRCRDEKAVELGTPPPLPSLPPLFLPASSPAALRFYYFVNVEIDSRLMTPPPPFFSPGSY
jgi:hypothetical protein